MIVCPFKDLARYTAVIPGLEEAMKAAAEVTDFTPRTIPLSDGNRINIGTYTTKPAAGGKAEAHRNYLDIQYVVKGEETMGWADLATLTPADEFNTEKDVGFYTGHMEYVRITQGNCYVVFPEDAHQPTAHLTQPNEVTKMVIKLKV